MFSAGTRLRSLVWSQKTGRVRAVWRVLVPVLTGFLALQLAGAVALTLGVNRGQMMLAAFAGTTLVMSAIVGISARYLDRRPLRAYGYSLSREWLFDLVVGTGIGTFVVAMTFVVARYTGSLRVTSNTLVPDVATLGWLVVFLAAFLGVSFYEEFIYRGAFVTNAVEASGDVAPVLAIAADEARSTRRLRRERQQVMVTYLLVIYISFAVFLGIIAALTVAFIPAVEGAQLSSPGGVAGVSTGVFEGIGGVETDSYVLLFYHAAAIQGIASGLIAGQLGEGSVSDGVKHATIMLLLAYLTFVIVG